MFHPDGQRYGRVLCGVQVMIKNLVWQGVMGAFCAVFLVAPVLSQQVATQYGVYANALRGQLLGTATNDDACAGCIGEVITNNGTVSLTSTTAADATSVSLTPGDWDVSVWVNFNNTGAATLDALVASESGTTNTVNFASGAYSSIPSIVVGNDQNTTVVIPPRRVSVSTTTTRYAVVLGVFTGTVAATAVYYARRAR